MDAPLAPGLAAADRPGLPRPIATGARFGLPLVAIGAVILGQLLAGRPGVEAALLLLLLIIAATGWLAGERPAALALIAAIVGGAALALRPSESTPADEQGSLLIFVATAVVTAGITIGIRRRDAALGVARQRRLDETERAWAEAESRATRLARLQALTESVARQLEPHEMARRVLDQAVTDVGAAAGVVISLDPTTDRAQILASSGFAPAAMDRWSSFALRDALPATEAMRQGVPLVIEDAAQISERYAGLADERPWSGSAIVIPLPYEDRIVGALYLKYPVVRAVPPEETSFLMAMGAACAAAVERSRLYGTEREARERAERAATRLTFLAEASQVLAGSLDLETTLHRLTDLAVPRIADWCAVRLVTAEGDLRLAAVAHSDPGRLAAAHALVGSLPARLADATGAGAVARTGKREVIPDIAAVVETRVAPTVAAVVRDLDLRTVVTVPLAGRSHTFGVLTLAWSGSIHALDDEELALADELASRAALALENATLHTELEGHARRLQAQTAEQAAVARLGQRALAGVELRELFDDALDTLRRLTGSDLATLVRSVGEGRACRTVASLGWDAVIESIDESLAASGAGLAIRLGAAINVEDLASERRFAPPRPMLDLGVRTGLAVPVAGVDGAWGAVALHRLTPQPFDLDDEHFVGAVANVLAAAIDRAHQQRELAARDQRLEVTLAASRTGTWEWDATSGRIELSDEACALYGLRRATVLPDLDAFVELAHPDDRAGLRTALESAIRERGRFEMEYRIVTPDGALRWASGVGRSFSERGVPRRLLGIVRDISERKAAEAEQERRLAAEREARQVGQAFIGVISHELRTPITSIYAGSKLLQRSGTSAGQREDIARDVEAEAERLYRLTEDLLVLTRLERGDLRIGGEPILLGHAVRRVVAAEQGRWPQVRFEVIERSATEPALGEEVYVEQVVRNLLSNAAKYGPAGSTVDLVVAPVGGGVAVRVLDRGPGVGDDPDELFELFYRAPQTASQASGAGIGLFVCRRLVEAMGGRLWARSRPDGGAEFGFMLERYDETTALDEVDGSVTPAGATMGTTAARDDGASPDDPAAADPAAADPERAAAAPRAGSRTTSPG